MSGSEDGQLQSPGVLSRGAGDDDEHDDTDSLDIKPPQANVAHSRDSTGSRRKERSAAKEKKHSKERRHKEHRRDRDGGAGNSISADLDRHGDMARREHRRGELEPRYHHHHRNSGVGGGSDIYDRDDQRELLELRYQKHYERISEVSVVGRGGSSSGYHHHHQQQVQYHHQAQLSHLSHHHQRHRQDYYERDQTYHQVGSGGVAGGGSRSGLGVDYHNHHHSQRHQATYGGHSKKYVSASSYGHGHDGDVEGCSEALRERRKYAAAYEQHNDAEILEQDLRSRLIIKRHKACVKDDDDGERERDTNENPPPYDKHLGLSGFRRHGNSVRPKDINIDRLIVDLVDSPERKAPAADAEEEEKEALAARHHRQQQRHQRKHKRRNKERLTEAATSMLASEDEKTIYPAEVEAETADRRKTPDDPELLARRAKILAAEREKERRKDLAREELEARRELRRERTNDATTMGDALSPSAVAASVTATLNAVVGVGIMKRKKTKEEDVEATYVKRSKRLSDDEDGEVDDDSTDEDDDEDDDDDDDEEDEDEEEEEEEENSETEDDDTDSASASGEDTDAHRRNLEYNREVQRKNATVSVGSYPKKSIAAYDSDGEIRLSSSPFYDGVLSKSPKRQSAYNNSNSRTKRRKKKKKQHRQIPKHGLGNDDNEDVASDNDEPVEILDDDDDALEAGSVAKRRPLRSHSVSGSCSRSPRSFSRTSRSHSRSYSHSSQSQSAASHSATSKSRSRSPRSRCSRSQSRDSHSLSRSRSRSGTRSEERDMKAHQRCAEEEAAPTVVMEGSSTTATSRLRAQHDGGSGGGGTDSPVRDEKGLPLPNYFPGIQGCRSVEEFQYLNRIEEGTYGVVYRARDKRTNEIVALKRLKMENEKEGFPITSLREINTLLKGQHPNIVTVREIVVGSEMDKIFIVMDYVEHDLKSLMETMKNRKQSFFPGEVKCLVQQLLRAVGHLHDNWILHRDLKTSNLLLSHKGILKVGDFGLAREYGSPLKQYTSIVVTLWYRAPEVLLSSREYSTPIDIWSVGCIFAEFLQMLPLFPGQSEIDQLNRIFKELGTPNEKIWPGYKDLPTVKNLLSQNSQFTEYPVSNLRKRFADKASDNGIGLLQGLLTYDPKQRLTADTALKHPYFKELPLPIDPSMFPTWPAKSELGARKALASSPKPPSGGSQFKQLGQDEVIAGALIGGGGSNGGLGAGGGASAAATGGSSSGAIGGYGKVVSGIITGNKKTASNTGFVLNAGIDQRQLAMGPGFSLKF